MALLALTDEQRAMLQLLLEGGQSYEDIGSLLGIGPDEVRSRARSALGEIGGADPDAQVGLSDYLLGQADPIGRADAVRQLQSDPESNALAERLVQNLRLLAPKAQLPEIPEPRGGRRAPAPPPAVPAQPPPTAPPGAPAAAAPESPGLASRVAGVFSGIGGLKGRRRTQFLVGLAAALALVIVVIVVATTGGSSADSSNCKPVDTSSAQQAGIPTMKLTAAGAAANANCPPSGQITLGRLPQQTGAKTQVATYGLQANTVHVPATASGEGYLFWLYKSDSQSVPLGPATADASGNLTTTLSIPIQELVLFPAFQTIRLAKVTPAQAQQVQQSIQAQGKKPTLLVPFVGDTVLQGNISELGLQQLLQQAQGQAQGQAGAGQAQQGGSGKKG